MGSASTSAGTFRGSLAPGVVTGTGTPTAQAVRGGAQPVVVSSVAVKIPRLDDGSPLDTTIVDPQLTQDVADTLGNMGTPDDGMDQLFTDMALNIDGDVQGLADTNSILGEITDTDYDSFQANTFDPITAAHGDVITQGQTLFDTFTT